MNLEVIRRYSLKNIANLADATDGIQRYRRLTFKRSQSGFWQRDIGSASTPDEPADSCKIHLPRRDIKYAYLLKVM
jgi:hypothetical protein